MRTPNKPIDYLQISKEHVESIAGSVIVETPVSLTVNSEVWLTFMCTPTDLEAMAVGFLYNEGVIQSLDEIAHVRLCTAGDNLDVWINHGVEKPRQWRRTSGCTGGVTSVEANQLIKPNLNGGVLSSDAVTNLVERLFDAQKLYRLSGGVHTSAMSDGQELLVVTEDIGRHNTLDKIAGRCLIENVSPSSRFILTTGRISSEMLQKAARMAASIVISRTSPSSLSIEFAEQMGITLIGYARRNRFNVYTHSHRIIHSATQVHHRQVSTLP